MRASPKRSNALPTCNSGIAHKSLEGAECFRTAGRVSLSGRTSAEALPRFAPPHPCKTAPADSLTRYFLALTLPTECRKRIFSDISFPAVEGAVALYGTGGPPHPRLRRLNAVMDGFHSVNGTQPHIFISVVKNHLTATQGYGLFYFNGAKIPFFALSLLTGYISAPIIYIYPHRYRKRAHKE